MFHDDTQYALADCPALEKFMNTPAKPNQRRVAHCAMSKFRISSLKILHNSNVTKTTENRSQMRLDAVLREQLLLLFLDLVQALRDLWRTLELAS